MVGPGPVRFRFRGAGVEAAPGESVAGALRRQGIRILQRSIRYHRPRSAYCGVGDCTGCLLRVDGRPNVRSCRLLPSEGTVVETENAWPSPAVDLLGLIDPLTPGGVDTLRGFRWPGVARPLYQAIVRRLAAYGRLPEEADRRTAPPARRLESETIVIGAGRSGNAVATALASAGRPVVVVDRDPVERPVEGATLLDRTEAVYLPPPVGTAGQRFDLLAVGFDGAAVRLRAARVVVAAGGYDGPLALPGVDRPGVMTAEGALRLAPSSGPPGFRQAVVVGAGERAVELLERFGPSVGTLVAPGAVGPAAAGAASELGVPIYPRTLLLEALGRRGVRAVRLAARGGGAPFTLEADAVLLAHRRLPNPQLYFQAGARMEWRAGASAYFPRLTERSESSVAGLFGTGESAGFYGGAAEASGRRLGADLAGAPLPSGAPPERVRADGEEELLGYYTELLGRPRPRGKWVVCPCEDVLLEELAEASARGFRGIEVVKRYTGVGSGLCQGRHCLPDALLLLALWERRPPREVGYITQRPPVRPVRLDALATLPPAEAEVRG